MSLIDRAPEDNPTWWYDYGVMAGRRVNALLRPEAGRQALMDLLHQSLTNFVAAGLDEAFLVRALVADLNEFAERMGDTGGYDAKIDEMRTNLLQIIEEPSARAAWRKIREAQDPEWLGRTDEDLIADARAGYESFGRKYATADDAAERWAAKEAWMAASAEVFPPGLFDHWTSLNTSRAHERL